MKKLFAISFIPGLAMVLLFVFWGDYFEELLKPEAFNNEFDHSNAWIVAIFLMISDLLLPIPASAVMAAIGSKYGLMSGFIINFSGMLLSGLTAYSAARILSAKNFRYICSEAEIEEYSSFFNKYGGASIIINRALPILPEVSSLMAGFVKMNFRQYLTSLALGSAGVALFYTWLGHTASKEPIWGIAIAVSLPLILWLLIKGSLKNERQIPQEISDKLSTMHEIVRTKQFFKLKALFTDQAAIELYHSIKSVEETIDSFYKNLGMALEIKTDFKILDFKEEAQYTLKIDYKETIKFEDKTITYEYIELINFQKNDLLITYIKCINKK